MDLEFAAEITQKKEELDPNFKGIFDKLIKTEDFDEEWEQTVFKISYVSLDTKDHASNISRFLSLLVNEHLMTDHNQLVRVLRNTSTTAVSTNRFRKEKIKGRKKDQ